MGAELPRHYHHDSAHHHDNDGAHHHELVDDYDDLGNVDEHDDHHLPLESDDNPPQ
jgi:hypothetical protein